MVRSDKKLLQLIREKPMALHHPLIRERFIDVLTIARFEGDRDRKKEALYLLKDYLIPSDKNWKQRVVPEINYKLAIELLKRLAEHLSHRCKALLKEHGTYPEDLEINDTYKDFIEWAKDREWRIAELSKESLNLLIYYPATIFIDDLTKELPSQKTLKDRL